MTLTLIQGLRENKTIWTNKEEEEQQQQRWPVFDVYELVWFNLYFNTKVVTLTLIQGHRSARKQNHLRELSHNVFNLNGIWRSADTFGFDEPHTDFISSN